MAASHLYLSTETNKSTGAKLRTKLLYIYTRVEHALRARIGPWALVGPPLGLPLGPDPSPGPSPGPWWGPAGIGPCGALGPSGPSPGPSLGPWALPWALREPCGDRALAEPLQICKRKYFQRLKTLNMSI